MDKENYAHAIDREHRWLPVEANNAVEAAIEAAYEYDYAFMKDQRKDIVLVGRTNWWESTDYASLIDELDILDLLDERIYDNVWEEVTSLREQSAEEEQDQLRKEFQSMLARWLEGVDMEDYFRVQRIREFEVVKYADDPNGPQVKELNE